MELAAVLSLLLSAVIHVGWNLAGKRRATGIAFFTLANASLVLVLLPIPLLYRERAVDLPAHIWYLVAATGFFEALYYAGLAGAYQYGEMSVAYPLARAVPVLLVAGLNFILGRGEQISPQSLAGMGLVFTGFALLPMSDPARPRLRDALSLSMLLALAAAVGTTGYSLVDDQALRLLRGVSPARYSPLDAALVYSFWQAVSSSLFLLPVALITRTGRQALAQTLRKEAGSALRTGIGIYTAYLLVMVAMAYVKNISYVVAFRQTSIPLGTLAGIFLLKERSYPLKLISSLVIFTGLVLVGTG